MRGSIRIGEVLGITVRVHWLFLALVFYLLAGNPQPLSALLEIAIVFFSVFLHELGHSLVARRFGIHVLDITFWPLGGMARMSRIPESPRIEGLIAAAGPAVNFVLAALALPAWILLEPPGEPSAPLALLAGRFLVANLVLGIFNLVPAFPMDGGRILRALLGLRTDWLRATELAVKAGRWLAGAMFLAGLLLRPMMPLLMLVAVFVWWAGAQELLATRARRLPFPFGPASAGGSGPASAAEGAAPAGPWSSSHGISAEEIERLERFRGRLTSLDRRP